MQQLNKNDKLVITGAAGLLGQNLVTELIQQGYVNITALDKDKKNLDILKQLHPQVNCVPADLSKNDDWKKAFEGAVRLFCFQAQVLARNLPFRKILWIPQNRLLMRPGSAVMPFTIFMVHPWFIPVAMTIIPAPKSTRSTHYRIRAAALCGPTDLDVRLV